ncbi:lipid droplet assembly factor 1-like isoform X1 [Ochotona curzoniae]|uniref:lipid droplet assembly factor 1-like isoform X1 n=3 Tax=Ochotona curzoniae TaxID=130825 RepID=UPI001B354411|nr:lipid droplet assembly factor 1-like isoform X1 [Ochotona curzoniae]
MTLLFPSVTESSGAACRIGLLTLLENFLRGNLFLRKTFEVSFRMVKKEPPSISKDFEELQRKLFLLAESIKNNSKVVSFMKSPVAQYLDSHPFLTLTLLVFIVMSALPVGFFLFFVVLTFLAALVGVILLEGLVISVGGLSLLCVLCGLGFVSFIVSGAAIMSYVMISSLIGFWFSPRPPAHKNPSGDCQLAMKSADLKGVYQE